MPCDQLSWHTIGPLLAQDYTVICPDNRGMGASTIPKDGDYSAATSADDLKALLDYLNINQTYIFSHDKGTGIAAALAAKYRNTIKRAGLSEYPLPGAGYEQFWTPQPNWDLYSNWQLAFFSVPRAAEFFIQGKEREMLAWYFWHASYSGDEAVSQDHTNRYAQLLRRPGFLQSMLEIFSTRTVAQDAAFFNDTLYPNPLTQPTIIMGGEASLGSPQLIEQLFSSAVQDITPVVVPKAGHWILDENPQYVARRLAQFFAEADGIPSVDLSYLADALTLGNVERI